MSNAKRPTGISNLRPTVGMLKTPKLAALPTGDPDSWRANLTSSTARGYGYKWQKEREEYLKANPLCVMCKEDGLFRPSTVVDHKEAHRGDLKLFWSRSNWQALCQHHHNSHAQKRDNEARR